MVLQKLKSFFESKLSFAILFALFFVLNIFDLFYVNLILATVYISFIFIFCDDISNTFTFLIVECLIKPLDQTQYYLFYYICLGFGAVACIICIIKQIAVKKVNITKGEMFWPLIVYIIAGLLGGVIGNASWQNVLYAGGLGALFMLAYFLARNFCKNFREKILFIFALMAFLMGLLYLTNCAKMGNMFEVIYQRTCHLVGAQNINAVAVYILIGIFGCFYLAREHKNYDYLFFMLATVLTILEVITFSRLSILLAVISYLALAIITIIKSQNKRYIYLFLLILFILADLLMIINSKILEEIVSALLNKAQAFLNGREKLWAWGIESFKNNPWFGIGFVSKTNIPTLTDAPHMVMMHNTAVQWLTSVGIVGSLMLIYYYYAKYRLVLLDVKNNKNNKKEYIVAIMLVVVALSGMLDPTACMGIIANIFILAILSTMRYGKKEKAVEQTESITQEENKKA